VVKVERFEDPVAWQKARSLTGEVYRVTRAGELARDFTLVRQMQRSAISIMSNIAEGFERNRPGEFHQFLSIAKGSCGELRSQMYIARDAGYLSSEQFDVLRGQAEEVSRVINGLRASIRR
jgi:four helix bundle protein